MSNPVEAWKAEKHGFDVWPNVLDYAANQTPMKDIDTPELERMKWHGVFYRKRDGEGSYMLRIRVTGCELTAEQAKTIAYIAYEFGHGIVDVTTRANIQIQGLTIRDVPRAVERLSACGLTARQTGHDNIRNVFGHPLSGVDPDELYDTRSLCRDISALFLDSRVYSDLPRKFNIAVSGRADHALHYWSQDLSFLACRMKEGELAFQVLIAGTQGQNPHLAWHLPVLVSAEQVVPLTQAVLDLFREKGSRERRDAARLRYLVEEIGITGVLEELRARLSFRLEPHVSPPPSPSGYEELIGWFPQTQPNTWALGLCVPLGRMGWQQLEGLALAARQWGDGTLRTTPEQGMMILNIPAGFRDSCATACAAVGLSPYADTLDRNTVACTGKQFCNIAVTETKGPMLQLVEKLRQRHLMLHGIRIHMSGCPSSCAQHFTADIGLKGVRVRRLLGTREGFDVFLGGGVAGTVHYAVPYKLGVDVEQLPQLIEQVIGAYYLHQQPGVTFSAYWRERLKEERDAMKVGDGEYSPPVWLCENCDYRHRGEDPPVFCPKCAGLRRYFARLESSAEEHRPQQPIAAAYKGISRADEFVDVVGISQIPESSGLVVECEGREIALFRNGAEVHAIDNACPHEGGPLGQGELVDGVVTCPWHGWTFNVCNGCSLSHPDKNVRVYAAKVEEGRVLVSVRRPSGQVHSEPLVRAAVALESGNSSSETRCPAP